MIGYHFTANTLRDGRPVPPIGEWLEHDGPVVSCPSKSDLARGAGGYRCSEHPFDALYYAPGNWLHRVELHGNLKSHGDPVEQWVGRRCRILATIDAEPLLREFARWCALQVIHLWDAPEVVRKYLETGDESLRAAAWVAAQEAWAVARDAARAAAEAARAAARDAALAAAWAARAAAEAAWAVARDAALAAVWAARAAAEAAWAEQRERFATMVEAAFAACPICVEPAEKEEP